MRTEYAIIIALSLSLAQCARATDYFLKDEWIGKDFLTGWVYFTEADLTHGRVNYLDQEDAVNKGLVFGAYSCVSFLANQFA
jgi:hypothetical protein